MYPGFFSSGLDKILNFHKECLKDMKLCVWQFQLLEEAGIMATYIYSSLDQTARKINVATFVNKKVMVMIVTDVAVSLQE